MNHVHPHTLLLIHRLEGERHERELRHRLAADDVLSATRGFRAALSSVWRAIGARSRTIAPRPSNVWEDMGLRPGR